MPSGSRDGAHDRIRLGISSCLLGGHVRYDGGHKRDAFLVDVLGPFVEWVPVCPEVELGLGIPRDTIRLVGDPRSPRLVVERTGEDITARMRRYARGRIRELETLDLDGYVLKRGSPSCGLFRVRVYLDAASSVPATSSLSRSSGIRTAQGRGAFAADLTQRMPTLPVEEEGRLADPAIRENFIERVFAAARWRRFLRSGPRAPNLVAFHAEHKLTLLAHDPSAYPELGRLVAEAGRGPLAATLATYGQRFMESLEARATRARHVNVLQHAAGFLKRQLSADERAELAEVIEDYRRGLTPVVAPITLLRHHVRRHGVSYLAAQHYLNPHPKELMLRNHV